MPAVSGDGLEKLEDMIVRAAESSADHVRAAKAAISTVIFGQDKVIEQAIITILAGRRQTQGARDDGNGGWARRAPHPIHARFDAVRHSRNRGAGGKPGRQAE